MKNFATLILLFLTFANNHLIAEVFFTNLALVGGDAGEIEDLKPQQLKNTQEQIKQKNEISDDDSKKFAALKEKGMHDYYIDYLIDFYKRKNISVKDLDVSRKDIDFYRVLKSGNFVRVYDLNEMNKEKPMTKEEKEVLYGLAKNSEKYLRILAFGIERSMRKKDIYLPNDLLKIIVFHEKYKLDQNIGLSSAGNFSKKYNIDWGDIDSVKKLMKNYDDVLENYKKRKP
ncbi:MAG: hypothetical protein WCJ72_17385 [Chryseobacterium sp.]